MVARLVRDQEVACSSHVTSTKTAGAAFKSFPNLLNSRCKRQTVRNHSVLKQNYGRDGRIAPFFVVCRFRGVCQKVHGKYRQNKKRKNKRRHALQKHVELKSISPVDWLALDCGIDILPPAIESASYTHFVADICSGELPALQVVEFLINNAGVQDPDLWQKIMDETLLLKRSDAEEVAECACL